MNTELFIAKRIISKKDNKNNISGPIVNIAIIGIALGLSVMILSVAIMTGFKIEIRNKVIGFGGHIQISNHDANPSFEVNPINKNQSFYPNIVTNDGIKHIQVTATKSGIVKTDHEIQGVVLKGIGSDYDWDFFDDKIIEGEKITITDTVKSKEVLISKHLADLLELKVGDDLKMYFVPRPPNENIKARKFIITGLYQTGLQEFDKMFVIVDIKQIQKLNNWTENQIGSFEILIDDFNKLETKTEFVNDIAGFNFTEDGSRLKVTSIKEKNPQEFDWLELQDLNVWVILILMTLVAAINMISGLLILILEKTSMIGILKSLGLKNWGIRKIFIYNAAYLVGKGMLWGNIIGISICLVQYYFNIVPLDATSYYIDTVPINLNITHLILLNIGTLIITVTILIIPSYLVTKISPVRAIRFE